MVCPGGVDVDFYNEYNRKDEQHNIIIQEYEWDLYQQYESCLQKLRYYSLLTHNSTVIVHHESFESQRTMELLRAPYFEMYQNVSKKTSIRTCKDLTKRIKNQIVLVEEFMYEETTVIRNMTSLPITKLFMRFVWLVIWDGVSSASVWVMLKM